MRQWYLPASYVGFAILSCLTIASVRSDLWVRQAVFFIFGASIFYTCQRIQFSVWLQYRWFLYAVLILLLLLPLLLGHSSRNTSRWIELGFFRLQPSQLALPLGSLVTACLLGRHPIRVSQLLAVLASWLPIAGIIFISPDLGTTAVYLAVSASLLWYSAVPIRWLATLAGISLVVIFLAWQVLLLPYQRERLLSFVAGTQQAEQQHYNAAQALIAVGAGQIVGRGWGKGTQSHLQFLPEKQTDFIFSSYSEEFGLLGTLLLLSLISVTTALLALAARRATSVPGSLYLMATATTFLLQAFVNIGMNIGLLPITGVTLPLMSYGGSSIVATAIMLGISQSIITQLEQNRETTIFS